MMLMVIDLSYDLTAITPAAGLVAGDSNAVVGTNLASDAIALDEWTNTTTTPLDVVYSFIPYDAVGCIGPSFHRHCYGQSRA